mmetsp:Transcript_2432/g.5758  ORF Transcript_2432/g.5758 Transcript_2432/m.5758 type:complete len:246 (+) Transcript_2432:383-1120(+)
MTTSDTRPWHPARASSSRHEKMSRAPMEKPTSLTGLDAATFARSLLARRAPALSARSRTMLQALSMSCVHLSMACGTAMAETRLALTKLVMNTSRAFPTAMFLTKVKIAFRRAIRCFDSHARQYTSGSPQPRALARTCSKGETKPAGASFTHPATQMVASGAMRAPRCFGHGSGRGSGAFHPLQSPPSFSTASSISSSGLSRCSGWPPSAAPPVPLAQGPLWAGLPRSQCAPSARRLRAEPKPRA